MPSFPPRSTALYVTGAVFALIGLALIIGGGWLIGLGGSPYYLLAGFGFLLTAFLLFKERKSALWVYAALLAGTLIWAVFEAGFDWWPLAIRCDVVFPLALWLLTPWITRSLIASDDTPSYRATTLPLWLAVIAGALVAGTGLVSNYTDTFGAFDQASVSAPANQANRMTDGQPNEDWRAYGRSQFGQRYSPLNEITPANVQNLKVAWTYRTGEKITKNDSGETTFEVTPIKIRDTLYLCSQHQRAIALDAKTGSVRWSFDPKLQGNPTFQHMTCRGVSYHEASAGAVDTAGNPKPKDCDRRILLPVNDGRLFALDADTGTPCESFGEHGVIDLNYGMGIKTTGFYEPTSPPIVSDKVLVVNGAVIDNYSTQEPSGVIRGFDIYTGKLVWAWDSGAADENALPSSTRPYTNNSPNSWAPAVFDQGLGLVYLPMGVRTPDIWGGNRDELSERYASSLVALDVNTGKRVWSYQTVHHDLWDMDLPSQPTLIDLEREGGNVPAIMVPTKTGNLFVLNRKTGELIVPAPERTVPQGAAPGDHTSPTQPFSQLTFRPEAPLTGADMWGATIFDQLMCRIIFHRLRYEGTFTPPSLQGTLVFPGNLGMFEWGGLAVDPVKQIAIANPMGLPFVSKLIPRGPDNPAAPNNQHPSGSEVGVQPMYGTPYGVQLGAFLSPIGIPCKQPPWGYIAGIDLKSMKVVWKYRVGTVRDSSPLPLTFKMGMPMLGGPLLTAGGVAFLTGTADNYIRAFDVTNGNEIWTARLPAGGQSTPMTYAIDGSQYVVTAAGGHESFGTTIGDYVIAYRLEK